MRKYISRFHYLTQDLNDKSHVTQVQTACAAGANWIQYRCLSKSDEELLNEINIISGICDDWGATLIVTDHVHLLHSADLQGVHIEDMSADFVALRREIGEEKTLGASANTIADIRRIWASGVVDYIGCGPLRITHTKPNDYPLLGLDGYKEVVKVMNDEGIDIPLIAVGGVSISDVGSLLEAGVYGVAVSAAVNLSEDPARALKEIYKQLY
ncbi:thiamine phosphate synthase [Desertivirga brevis]|uniref:thiamine phosphate synthase n=1 Tax=Desertivirga brevis TaxID=2810310 RepID=UPI001A96F5DC|nr:thiamine phosphate synthase [Pedobacter sp. SYSU D00873]